MKLVTVAEMQAVERQADAAGLSYSQMMEHAGYGLAEVSSRYIGETEKNLDRLLTAVESGGAILFFDEAGALHGKRSEVNDSQDRFSILEVNDFLQKLQASIRERSGGFLGLVGTGKNGGDTLVALAHLANQGWKARAYLVRPRPADDPLVERLIQAGGRVISGEEERGAGQLEAALDEADVLLDGVLGTGFALPLRSPLTDTLARVKVYLRDQPRKLHVVAVDCPSGVDCDSGEAAPESLPADLTVTMAAVKTGLLKPPASHLTGEVRVAGIGLETMALAPKAWQDIRREVVDRAMVQETLPARPPEAHKGTFGTVLVVAGSVNYTGAALLAGKAAYRTGAGLVTLAVPVPLHNPLAGQFPEATWLLLPAEKGVIAAPAAGVLLENITRASSLLVGPGLGIEKTTRKFLNRLLEADADPVALPPMVIDADGLKLLSCLPDWPARLPGTAVLTPHPGEMSVLTGLSVAEIQSDRLGIAERYSSQWQHVVVLKGAHTVIASPDGRTRVIPVATAALARAGTGDVLAGIIAGLRAQGVEAFDASTAGCWIHAQCGLVAAAKLGSSAAVLAGDVLDAVGQIMASLQN